MNKDLEHGCELLGFRLGDLAQTRTNCGSRGDQMWWMMRMILSGWSPGCWVFDRSDFQIERGMKFYHSYSLFLFCLPTIKIQKKLKRQIKYLSIGISLAILSFSIMSIIGCKFIYPSPLVPLSFSCDLVRPRGLSREISTENRIHPL